MGELPMLQQRLATSVMATEDMVGTVGMEDMDTMERDLLRLMLSQDTSEEDMVDMAMEAMVVMDMAVDTMARGRLKLMLSQATFPEDMDMEDMVMEVMVAMGMAVVIMARGRLKLSQDISEDTVVMVMDVDMEVMDMDVDTMARGRLMLNQDILEDMVVMAVGMDMEAMDMVDMAIMVEFLLILFKNKNKEDLGKKYIILGSKKKKKNFGKKKFLPG